jgi:hypothetical protein
MRKPFNSLTAVAAAIALSVVACSDAVSPSAPSAAPQRVESGANNNLLGGLIGGLVGVVTNTLAALLADPLERNTPLANDIKWSFTVGPSGGVSSNYASGLTIVVPPGALSTTKTITVTALKGDKVAYGFEPHGLVFERKVVLTQNLRVTNAGLFQALSGAHFSGDRPESVGSLIKVTEIVPSLTSIFTRTTSFGIGHFSGWIVATGRASSEDGASEGY